MLLRPGDGRAADPRSGEPLLEAYPADDHPDRGRSPHRGISRRGSPLPTAPTTPSYAPTRSTPSYLDLESPTSRRGALRSRSPNSDLRQDARRRYTYAAFFLAASLASFTVQTELAAYIQHDLGWDKAYCMLYLTHSSWVFLFPLQLLFLRLRRREISWDQFWRSHLRKLKSTAMMVQTQDVRLKGTVEGYSPVRYLVRTTAGVTTALTVAGLSWYIAVSMTTPSDLTAIYNCSAFFAYAFSVLLLKERLRMGKSLAVAVAIIGVLVVAYGDGGSSAGNGSHQPGAAKRLAGNLIIGVGSVLYGLYEVLYKRYACPPDGTDATRGMIFANTFGSLIGLFTMLVLWIPLPLLHMLGWERFELPTGQTAWLLFISVVMNMVFSGSFLVLISLTSPVLSSVAALLTIFIVAIVDWMWTGTPLTAAAVAGGLLIVFAFAMLAWSTWREMDEEARRQQVDLSGDEDDD